MLTPEPMQRAVILAAKNQQAVVIEALHDLRAAHFIDFHETTHGDLAGFRMGTPLPGGGAASQRLVRVRALLRHLGLEGAQADRAIPIRDLEARLDRDLDQVEAWVSRAAEARERLRTSLAEDRELEAKLEPLATLPLRLDDYRGYEALAVFVGRADPAFRDEVARAVPDALLVPGEDTLFALFVPREKANEAGEILFRHGYAEIEIPPGTGSPDERLREIHEARATHGERLEKAEAELARLAREHRDFLLAAEEHLSILVEKAEAPLAFATTENAFLLEAWVPLSQVDAVEGVIRRATGDQVHFQRFEVETHHGHTPGHGESDAGVDAPYDEPHAHAPEKIPPTKYANPGGIDRFQWFTDLFSRPRYGEIDPTPIFAVFFPLFFGFMIGDLGLGILMILLGWLLIRKLPRVDGMKQLGTAFVVAGIVAAVLGGIVFKDALGIPLGFNHHMEEKLHEMGLAEACTPAVYEALHEANWGCLLGGNVWHAEPLVYKVSDVDTMLLLSVGAAFVHLLIGLLIGIRNEIGHGAKHVAAKVGYLVLLLTFFPAVVALLSADFLAGFGLSPATAYMTAGGGFVLGAIILGWAEGFAGILEIPSMFSAIMSYLRLGAVAIAKGAMAVAFNNLTLVAALTGGAALFVLGLLGFLVAQTVLFVLGLLSGGIQALRLNFVEFFTKFYKGGGVPFKPFGRERRVTVPAAAPGAAAVATVLLPTNESS